MENASKALIMAGLVLLSLLIIGALVFMFNSLSNLKQTEATSKEVEKLVEYNKQIESFNRDGLYGSEILSLANLIDDYNKRQADLKGYQEIKLSVNLKNKIDEEYMTKMIYNGYSELLNDFKKLEKRVDDLKKKKISIEKNSAITVEKAAGMRENELENLLKNEKDIQKKLKEIYEKTDEYAIYKSAITQFKNTKFNRVIDLIQYDEYNGRIIELGFEALN